MKSSEASTSKSRLGSHPKQGFDPCISTPKEVKRKAPVEVAQDDPALETVSPDLSSQRNSITPESSQIATHFACQDRLVVSANCDTDSHWDEADKSQTSFVY